MLLLELFDYLNEGKNVPSTSATKIPTSLINELYYHIYEIIVPGIFDYITQNNIDINDFINNTQKYQYQIYQDVIEKETITKYFSLLNKENDNFLAFLMNNQIFSDKPFKLFFLYHTNNSILWDDYYIRNDKDTDKDRKSSGYFSFVGLNKYEGSLETFITINLSNLITSNAYQKYLNDKQDFYDYIHYYNTERVKTTLRHELEHYYQLLNKLIKNIKRFYEDEISQNVNQQQILQEIEDKLEKSDSIRFFLYYKIKGHEYLETNTRYLASIKNPYKRNSQSSAFNSIDRSYYLNEDEIATKMNDFIYLYAKYTKDIFLDHDSAILWLKQFLKQFDLKYIGNSIEDFMDTETFFAGKEFSINIQNILNKRVIKKDEFLKNKDCLRMMRNLIEKFSSEVDYDYLVLLKEILSTDSTQLISDLNSNIDKNRYINDFISLKKEFILNLYRKFSIAWNDPDLFNI